MRYVLLLLGWITWTGAAFAQGLDQSSKGNLLEVKPPPAETLVSPPANTPPAPSGTKPNEALNFRYHGESQAEFETREKRCLAIALYFEGNGWSERGKVAIGQVILNRVRSPEYPETICGVVYEDHKLAPNCQFSFSCDGKTDVPRNDEEWSQAQDIARRITHGELWLPEVGYSIRLTDPPVAVLRASEVVLIKEAGTFKIPVLINGVITLHFVLDSGASDVSIPADVVMTLMRTGTLRESDFLGRQTYTLADGSRVPSEIFRIRELKVGDRTIQNVVGSVANVKGSLLLGQSFLSKFNSWSIDNGRQVLILR
jgi:hypothetical protein